MGHINRGSRTCWTKTKIFCKLALASSSDGVTTDNPLPCANRCTDHCWSKWWREFIESWSNKSSCTSNWEDEGDRDNLICWWLGPSRLLWQQYIQQVGFSCFMKTFLFQDFFFLLSFFIIPATDRNLLLLCLDLSSNPILNNQSAQLKYKQKHHHWVLFSSVTLLLQEFKTVWPMMTTHWTSLLLSGLLKRNMKLKHFWQSLLATSDSRWAWWSSWSPSRWSWTSARTWRRRRHPS